MEEELREIWDRGVRKLNDTSAGERDMKQNNIVMRSCDVTVTAWRDHGDGYPDGVVLSGIYGDISPCEAAEIQDMMNSEDTKIYVPTDPIGGLVGVVCDVRVDYLSEGWEYTVNHVVVVDMETTDTTTYPSIAMYERDEEDQYIRKMAKIDVTRMYVADRTGSFIIALGLDLDITTCEYRGIKYMIHRDVFRDKTKWCATERISGSTIPSKKTFPDEIRAEAAFRDMVDENGVLNVCHTIMTTYRKIDDAKLITIDEYNMLHEGEE